MRGILLTLIFLNLLYFGWKFTQNNQSAEVTSASQSTRQGVPEVVLLSEKNGRKSTGQTSEKSRPIAFCPQVGPFTDKSAALLFATQLQTVGISARLKDKSNLSEPRHWVYLPVSGSQKTAMQTLSELREKKVDSYLITKGELKGNISLGIFASQDSAMGLQNKLQALEVDAKIYNMQDQAQEFWLSVDADKLNAEQEQALQQALEQRSEIKVVQSAC